MKILEEHDTDTCMKMLKIEIPTDEIDHELDDVYSEFVKNANVPGFRKGKIPRSVAKLRYGKELRQEAVQKAMGTAFKEATEELNLKPIAIPDLKELEEEQPEGDEEGEGKSIVFEARFEYKPELESVDYQGIKVEPPSTEVSEREVMDIINRAREENAMYANIDDRPVVKDDQVTISSKATIEGEPFPEATHESIAVQVGSGRYLPGFEDALIGMNIGEEKEITLTLPEDYPVEDKRGKQADFHVKVEQIREKKLPELDDEFAKDLGEFDKLDELKERLRNDLKQRMEMEKEERIFQSIRNELLQRNVFDVPPSMVEARYKYINSAQDAELRRAGSSLDTVAQQDEHHLERNKQRAEQDVKISIILKKIAEVEYIDVSDEEYMQHITPLSYQYGMQPTEFLKKLEADGLDDYFREEALEGKVLRILRERALATESETTAEPEAGSVESEEEQSGTDSNGSGADEQG